MSSSKFQFSPSENAAGLLALVFTDIEKALEFKLSFVLQIYLK